MTGLRQSAAHEHPGAEVPPLPVDTPMAFRLSARAEGDA
jgi:hypothetical protein